MRASTLLRACLLGLVLTGVVFVQLTGSAGLRWLLPLYALTALAPLLVRLREKLVYRGLWNATVLGVFAVLVNHAAGSNLRFVLEDGLVLAALCQVHLLNNLRDEQSPDLLFLNSFLIAIVTGYLSQGLAYAIVFLVYALLFVLSLQLRCFARQGTSLPPSLTLSVVRDGLVKSGLLLAGTMAVFLLWPRDFQRQGFLVGRFDFASSGSDSEIGFADRLGLERGGRASVSDRVVMTVELLAGSLADVPPQWRGATLGATNGNEWWPLDDGDLAVKVADADPWRGEEAELVRGAAASTPATRAVVTVLDARADRLFAPLSAGRIRPLTEGLSGLVAPAPDGTLRLERAPDKGARPRYELGLDARAQAATGGLVPERLHRTIAPYAVLPRTRRLESARELADRLAERLPARAEQQRVVEAFSEHLRTRYRYLPPGEEGAAGSLTEFLAGEAGGHCEFFASALASMLRSRGIPCRIATGYRSTEWDATGRVLTFRARDAHAWVEVFDPQAGWISVDPIPFTSAEAGQGGWQDLRATLSAAWARLAGFNAEGRAELFGWLRSLPARLPGALRAHPLTAALVLVGALLVILRARRCRRSVPASVRRYHAALRRSGLQLGPGETPHELLARARSEALHGERLEALRQATREHEHARYAA